MQNPSVQDPTIANFLQQQGQPVAQSAMATPTSSTQPAAHELLHINEILRLEACDVLHTVSSMATVQDPELRQLLQSCAQTGKAHLQALMTWCNTHHVTHVGGVQ